MSQASVASNINPVRVLTPTGPDIEPQFSDSSSSFMDVLDTFRKWNTSSLVIQKFAANGYEPDPEFQIDDTTWRELTHNVPSDLWDSYSDAVSLPHAYHLAEINRIVAEKRQILANSSGPSSFLAPVVGSFLDPGAVALGIITGGGSTVLRMGMGARAVTLGGLNAAASGALTGLESTIDPAVTGADIARSVAGGAGFGAAAGAFGTSSRAVRAVTGAAGQALPPLAIDLFDERPGNAKAIEFASNLLFGGVFNALPGPDATPEQFRVAETLNKVGKNMLATAEGRPAEPTPIPQWVKDQFAANSPTPPKDSTSNVNLGMGAAGMQIPEIRIPKDQRSLDLSERIPTLIGQDAPRAAFSQKVRVGAFDFGLFRWDMVGMTGGSDVPEIRLVGSLAGDDPTLPVDGSPRQIGAAHWVSSRVGETEARALLVENEAFAARLDSEKANGIPYMQRTSKTQFEAEITRALRQGIPEGTDPHVAKAANEYRKLFDEIVELAKDHNINLNYASNYVNRIHLGDARELRAKEIGRMIDPNATPGIQRSLGMQVITDFFSKAIESEYVKRGENVADPKIIADIRGKAQSIIDKAGISNLTDDTTGASIGSGKNRTYERIELDETYSQTITLDNGQSVTLSVEDFIENNIGVLFSMYTRQMHGYMAISRLSEILGAKINPEDANSKEGVNAILRMVEERAKERGLSQDAYSADLERLRVLLSSVAQISVFETTKFTRFGDVMRNGNVVQYMANFGTALANLTTIVDTAAQHGLVNTMKSLFPSVMDVVNQLRGGKGSRRQALELYHMGIGMERQLRRVMPRVGEDAGSPVGRSKVELGTAKAAKLAMDASLQTFAQDLAALVQGRAFMYNFDDIARSGNMPSERRLALWTLDKPTVQRIVEQFKLHALAEDGQPAYVNGQRRKGVDIEYTNLEAWDAEIRQRYKDAMYAEYRRIIQPGERSQMPYFFTTPIGRIIGQFRSFTFQAHVNRFLAELQVRDSIAVKKLIYGSVAAAALYAGRTYLDAQMREDPGAYLEEKLSPENLWKSAFARASYSALFPTIWDSLYSDILGNDPTFSFARTTDLQGGIMFGSPTVQRLKELGAPMIGDGDVMRLPRAAFNMATGDGTQKDWRVIKAGIPIPDFLNFRKFLDEYVRNNLPTTTMSN